MPDKQDGSRDEKGRFVKGVSGNAKGRHPVEFSFTSLLRAKVADRPAIVERLVELCASEDENVALKAILGIANRLDGMPKQAQEITGADGGPVAIVREYIGGES